MTIDRNLIEVKVWCKTNKFFAIYPGKSEVAFGNTKEDAKNNLIDLLEFKEEDEKEDITNIPNINIKCNVLEQTLFKMLELHDIFLNDPSPENAYTMKDGFDMIRQAFKTVH